jgi:adenosylmethionine-8-amino-7-oxononanoate aminotransferase
MVREFQKVSIPYCYRCEYACRDCAKKYAAEVEAVLATDEEIAAFIFEPISGATLGAAVPPNGYLQQVAEICSRHGLLLIADEVMTGMGRTGRNFAIQHWGIAPDIIVAAKGLSSGYAPLGAVIANRKVVDGIANGSGAFIHGFTYNAHPVSVAAGLAVLHRMREQKLIEAAAASDGAPLRDLEVLMKLPFVGDVRGMGLLGGIEFVSDQISKQPFAPEVNFAGRVAHAALRRGLLPYPIQGCVDGYSGDHLLIAPPAVITKQQIEWAVEKLQGAIEEAAASVK